MNEEEEFTPVTKKDVDHTNIQGDVAAGQKHFLEISFEGFRLCETTSEDITLEEFNATVLGFWKKLDDFLQKTMERKMKKRQKMERGNSYVG
jgi:hypothetical protein